MKQRTKLYFIKGSLLLIFSLLLNCSSRVRDNEILQPEKTILLPNVNGRIDHIAYNSRKQIAFIAALGNNSVEIIDLAKGEVIHSIKSLSEPQGIIFMPESNSIFLSNGGNGECDVFDAETFQKIHSVRLGGDADNVRYDSTANKIYVGYGNGGIAIVDVKSFKTISKIQLSAHPESFQIDKAAKKIYVNVPGADVIEVIDLTKNAVTAQWKMTEAKANFPMALDEAHHRLFVGCRHPSKLLVLDTQTGEQISSLDIDRDVDDIFYNGGKKELYLSCGGGYVDIIKQTDADNYSAIGKISTGSGARSSLFISEQNKLLVAVPSGIGKEARLMILK